ncbi:MAG TPA: THUMP domain-containing protein [Candidatus Dormibacteraeota bacterium]|nr:THUMP domain-containing protein [Candidatus Dormibacteraeota bacterium]
MLKDFNLVVSTSRGNERNVCSEMWYLLGEVGDRGSTVEPTPAIGLVVAKTKLEPTKAVHDLRGLLKERPWEFKYTLRLVPIQSVSEAKLDTIESSALAVAQNIGDKETFRVTVEKRHTGLSSKTIIDTIAKKVNRKVKLENPDRVIMIDVIGDLAGISLVRANDILSVEREKRKG